MRNVDFKSYPEFCHPNTSASDEADGGAIVLSVGPIDDETSRGFDAEPDEVDPAPPPHFYICGAYFAYIALNTQLPWHVEWPLWGRKRHRPVMAQTVWKRKKLRSVVVFAVFGLVVPP